MDASNPASQEPGPSQSPEGDLGKGQQQSAKMGNSPAGYLQHQSGQLAYHVCGSGPQYMVLFHGYAQDATSWLPLVASFTDAYTFVLVDLYFHGQSSWADKQRVLSVSDWRHVMTQLLDQLAVQQVTVGGFSIGCKFALATIASIPHRVKDLILVAPDGLVNRFWYQVATSTSVGRAWFKQLITKPGVFFRLANMLHSIGLLDRNILTFVGNQMNTRQKRLKVYCTWTVFRGLKFAPRQIADTLNQYQIPLTVFLGKWDGVISRRHVAPLLGLVKNSKVQVLEASHHNLVQKVAQHYQQTLLAVA
jgi:pimeloyl-ACP methyl ester carboxylesterase